MTHPTSTFKSYVESLIRDRVSPAAPFAIDRGLGGNPETLKIRAVLEDALVVEKHQASVGPEIVHFATIRTLYPLNRR